MARVMAAARVLNPKTVIEVEGGHCGAGDGSIRVLIKLSVIRKCVCIRMPGIVTERLLTNRINGRNLTHG